MTKNFSTRSSKDWETRLAHSSDLLKNLQTEIAAYKSAEPYSITNNQTGSELQLIFNLKKVPPNSVSLLTSDLIHNARSSLDNFIFASCELIAGRELTFGEAKEFDFKLFADSKDATKQIGKWARKHPEIGPGVGNLLLSLQSFSTPSPYWDTYWSGALDEEEIQDQHDIMFDMLQRLITLSNIDKHRRIMVPWLAPSYLYHSELKTSGDWVISMAPLISGEFFAKIELDSPQSDSELDVGAELEFRLEGSSLDLMNLEGELEAFIYWVRQAIKVLEFELSLVLS